MPHAHCSVCLGQSWLQTEGRRRRGEEGEEGGGGGGRRGAEVLAIIVVVWTTVQQDCRIDSCAGVMVFAARVRGVSVSLEAPNCN